MKTNIWAFIKRLEKVWLARLFSLTLSVSILLHIMDGFKAPHYFLWEAINIAVLLLLGIPMLLKLKSSEKVKIIAENELNEIKEEFRDTVREQQGMTFKFKKVDGKFIHTLCDGALLYRIGLTPEQVVGKELHEFLSQSNASQKELFYERAWNGEENVVYEGEANGITYLASLRPVMRNGEICEVIASCIDITNLKKAEELIKRSEKLSLVGELAAGVAHEIRNPLTSLLGFVQLLERQGSDPHYLEVMKSELHRINFIVSEFLVLAKPHLKQFQEHDIRNILNAVMPIIETQAAINNVEIVLETNDVIPMIKCEENQLKQVFVNLLKNGIESMSAGGVLSIEVNVENDLVLVRIIDQGCGIPQNIISRIGEPFYTTKEKGTGLGIMVCYKIIEDHHGKMSISSELKKGTTVEIKLPIHALAEEHLATA
ncbi:ATP-binding protein [Ammoniphilus sp. 3BR4]|uniref:ATP-binding protein n=1 Tax=Ammoniphilus sp. 3BR4 TaxID=3158265 RepID=UPI003465AF16